jgi:hypothetical protein
VLNSYKIRCEDILYYCTSGGGIPGFFLAKKTPHSTLFMSNVQTDIREYDQRTLEKLVQVSFDGDMSYVKKARKNQNRFSINGHCGLFNIIYSQNQADTFHYERHYKRWKKETNLSFFQSVKFIEYNDVKTGHGPLDAIAEIGIIRGIVEGEEYDFLFPNVNIDEVLKTSEDSGLR